MRELSVGDNFILHSSNGKDYDCIIYNINNCRPPEMKYALDVKVDGKPLEDFAFVSEQFFQINEDIIEFKEN